MKGDILYTSIYKIVKEDPAAGSSFIFLSY